MFPGEVGARFVEICQGAWDHPTNLHPGLVERCRAIEQAAALLTDLRQRRLLDDTPRPVRLRVRTAAHVAGSRWPQSQHHDLHATLLAFMGLDHKQLTYRYAGRPFTDVPGEVHSQIFS